MASIGTLAKAGITKIRVDPWERFSYLEIDVSNGRFGPWGKLHAGYFPDNVEPRPLLLLMAGDGAWLPWEQFTDKEWVEQMGNAKVACCPGHARIRDGIKS